MNESIFSRIFSYRERETNAPIENFLIEIFAFCLETDPLFSLGFKNLIFGNNHKVDLLSVSTQQIYPGLGRPDIEIRAENVMVLIECKVEASERNNQLRDYTLILNQQIGIKKKQIIFLTKYYEYREPLFKDIELHLHRWFDIYNLINESNTPITLQLKQFLKENNMDTVKNFTLEDMLAMKTITATISKMDELLDQFKPQFESLFGGYSKDSSRSSRLKNSAYINYSSLHYQRQEYYVLIGFFWWWGEEVEIPYVGIMVEVPRRKFADSDLPTILNNELVKKKEWEFEEYDNLLYYSAISPLSDFISMQDDNLITIKKYINDNLSELKVVKTKYPKILKK